MPRLSTPPAAIHPALIRSLHWATLVVLITAYSLVLARDAFEDEAVCHALLNLHRYVGLAAWGLALLRLVSRSRLPMAPAQTHTPLWERMAAGSTHALLYLLLLGVPLLGWALTSARGQPISLGVLGLLPAWPAKDLDLADTLQDLHELAAWSLAALVGAHAAAALWHHHVRKDAVLVAMLPGLARATDADTAQPRQSGLGQPSRGFR
jgi:superoxide oxidase